MSESIAGSSSQREPKNSRYGMSCVGCRRRKQRCDARTPVCGRCQKLKEACIYDSLPRSQLASQLYPLVSKMLVFMQSLVSPTSTEPDSALRPMIKEFLEKAGLPSVANNDKEIQIRDWATKREDIVSNANAGISPSNGTGSEEEVTHYSSLPSGDPTGEGGEAEVDELLMHMSLADDGQNGHYGPTSFVWQTPSPQVVERLQRRISQVAPVQGDLKYEARIARNRGSAVERKNDFLGKWSTDEESQSFGKDEQGILKANASMLGSWESLAFHKLLFEEGQQSADMTAHLLKTYFCWQYGSHCVVYRPVFTRDMALGGPYFNNFLLNVICAHASRYSDIHIQLEGISSGDGRTPALSCGTDYLSRAKLLLAVEMDKPSSVPTIQGLLLLGQRECACGNLSQGWQYTGMAFRAMRDLGIHLDCSRLPIFGFGTLSVEDHEIRRRLFWSAFTWDKIISLALGRTPTFNAWQNVSPGPIVDDTEDDDEWRPHFWNDITPPDMIDYPVQKSLTTLNFRHAIKLCEIIQKIIMRLYDGRPQRLQNINFVMEMRTRLISWLAELPSSIKMDINHLPEHCPPPHIFSTNALYRATWILLYRLFLPHGLHMRFQAPASISNEAVSTCTQMADELHQLFTLYGKSFKFRNMTYTLSWSMYSAATINAFDFQSPDPDVAAAASPRLGLSLHVLERGSLQTPGTARSIEIIKRRLRQPLVHSGKRPRDLVIESRRHSTANEDAPESKNLELVTIDTSPTDQTAVWDLGTEFYQAPSSSGTSALDDPAFLWTHNQLMQEGNASNGMDLLQGMMAIPSIAAAAEWNWNDWTEDSVDRQ